MKGSTHLMCGLIAGVPFSMSAPLFLPAGQTGMEIMAVSTALVALGAVFADVDSRDDIPEKSSKIAKLLPFISIPIHIIQKKNGHTDGNHRYTGHCLLFNFVFSVLIYVLMRGISDVRTSFFLSVSFTVGWMQHLLLLDINTKGKVPLFLPFTNKKFGILKFDSNSVFASLFAFFISSVVSVFTLYFMYCFAGQS